jgi:uncharacterized protein YjiK
LITFCSCGNPQGPKKANVIGYTLTEPDKTIILPGILHEISGLAVIDSSSVACVQDENGAIFIFDLLKGEIKKQIDFSSKGDYEGIALADKTIFVLRSDGVLFRVKNYELSSHSKKINLSGIKEGDNEGLCYDPENSRLLIVPKRKPGKDSGLRKYQLIFGYDLISDSLLRKPVIEINLASVAKFIRKNSVAQLKKAGKKSRKQEPTFQFRPSEIAIHPVTNKIYLLSSEEHMLFVFDAGGTIEYAEKLDPTLLNKPEGLAFFNNGDMLISNESGGRYPTILRFNYKPE